MVSTTYRTGTWLGIVRSGTVIVLRPDTDSGTVTKLWEFLADAPTIDAVLNEVTRTFGTELTGMPPFGILVMSDRLHAVLRGDMTLHVRDAADTSVVSGRDVTTWSERSLPLPAAYELVVGDDGATAAAAPVTWLPLGDAVVHLGALAHLVEVPAPAVAVGEAAEPVEPVLDDGAPAGAAGVDAPAMATAAVAAAPVVPDFSAMPAPAESDIAAPEPASDEAPPAEAPAEESAGFAAPAADAQTTEGEAAATGDPVAELPDAELPEPEATEPAAPEHPPVAAEEISDAATGVEPVQDTAGPEASALLEDDTAEEVLEDAAVADLLARADEEAYARFALAADAEWSAQLDPEANSDGDAEDEIPGNYEPYETLEPAMEASGEVGTAEDLAAVDSNDPGESEPESDAEADADADASAGDGPDADQGVPFVPVPLAPADIPPMPPAPPSIPAEPAVEPVEVVETPEADAPAESTDVVAPAVADAPGETTEAMDAVEPGQSKPVTGPLVLARLCPQGHANPPSRSLCWDCGEAITGEPLEVSRPHVGRMHISNGGLIDLDRTLVIGRQPSVSRVEGGAMPRLIQVVSSSGDISRSHAEVRVDGWDVLLVDLFATNGTVLVRQGEEPRRLAPGEQVALRNDDRADLGDGVILHFDEIL